MYGQDKFAHSTLKAIHHLNVVFQPLDLDGPVESHKFIATPTLVDEFLSHLA